MLSFLRLKNFFLLHQVAREYKEGEIGAFVCICGSGEGLRYEGKVYSSFELARNCLSELSVVVRDDTDLATLAEVLLRWIYATSAASAPRARTWRAVIP